VKNNLQSATTIMKNRVFVHLRSTAQLSDD